MNLKNRLADTIFMICDEKLIELEEKILHLQKLL